VDTAKLREIAVVVGDAGGYSAVLDQAADELDARRRVDAGTAEQRQARLRKYRAALAGAAFDYGRRPIDAADHWYRQQAEHVDRAAYALVALEQGEPLFRDLLVLAYAVMSGEIDHQGEHDPERRRHPACPACTILADVELALGREPEPPKGSPT
jgi:hypothetical protein